MKTDVPERITRRVVVYYSGADGLVKPIVIPIESGSDVSSAECLKEAERIFRERFHGWHFDRAFIEGEGLA